MTDIVFVDTGAWFASIVPTDPDHLRAKQWLDSHNPILITTDYVVGETLTLLRARGERKRALQLGEELLSGNIAEIFRISDEEFSEAWQIFRNFDDKNWSFTDCSSKVVMSKLGITKAFAFDHHFKQFGSVRVIPE
jgi:predicted nucleic acid-binding protein